MGESLDPLSGLAPGVTFLRMRGGSGHLRRRAWAIPLLVACLVLPAWAGMMIAGPGLGLALGQLCASGLVLYAALQKPNGVIEVAKSSDERRRILVLATEAVEEPAAIDSLLAAAAAGDDVPPEVLVLAPARSSTLSEWLSDVAPGRDRAQVRLVHSVAALAAAGVEAEARVGDPDVLQAVEDTLRSFPADEVIAVTGDLAEDRTVARAVSDLRDRLRIPMELVAAGPPRPGSPV